MESVLNTSLKPNEAAVWFLGQAGFIVRSAGVTVVIDPYLSDSAARGMPEFSRAFPPPLDPTRLRADIYIVTHDHADHLDPETLQVYRHKHTTDFVAPRLAARKLSGLGIPQERIERIDAGETHCCRGVEISGIYAVPTGADVIDTTGYLVRFANGRSFYHASDTAWSELLLKAAPRQTELLLTPINGKFGNLNVEQAADLTNAVQPRFVAPFHYDMMSLNSENPESFRWFLNAGGSKARFIAPRVMEPWIWGGVE